MGQPLEMAGPVVRRSNLLGRNKFLCKDDIFKQLERFRRHVFLTCSFFGIKEVDAVVATLGRVG